MPPCPCVQLLLGEWLTMLRNEHFRFDFPLVERVRVVRRRSDRRRLLPVVSERFLFVILLPLLKLACINNLLSATDAGFRDCASEEKPEPSIRTQSEFFASASASSLLNAFCLMTWL